MASKKESNEVASVDLQKMRYNWDELLNGCIHLFRRGVDYRRSTHNMRAHIACTCRKRGYVCATRKTEGGLLVVCVHQSSRFADGSTLQKWLEDYDVYRLREERIRERRVLEGL